MVRAIVLLSGGLDSCVTACIADGMDYELYALSFDYGQRHRRELESAKKIAQRLGMKQRIIRMELPERADALTSSIDVPHGGEMGKEIPATYVPARNTIFIAYALSWSEVLGAEAIFIGANAVDFSGYPDCTGSYIEAWNELIKVGMKNNKVKLIAPLIDMSKGEIVKEGVRLGAPLELTWSCYEGRDRACGMCDSCRLRLKGFREAGIKDPADYEGSPENGQDLRSKTV
jgi:7-cyano-7-deazaguanine synthase